jgi:CHASE3 domain sensor protein
MRSAADRAVTDAKAETEATRDTARQATAEAQTQAAATAQMTSDEAKKLLDQAVVYVKENKYDLAEKALTQVEAQKAALPRNLQDQLTTVRAALTTAKAGGGLKIPGLGGGDTNK